MTTDAAIDSVKAGERQSLKLQAGSGPNEETLEIVVHVVRGRRDGPTLVLLATAHGDEWGSVEPMRRLLAEIDPLELRGSVLAVPVAHPPALAAGARNAPGEPDHNRIFPGGPAGQTNQLVARLAEVVLSRSDAVVDFHGGGWGHLLGVVTFGTDYPDPAVNETSRALARAFGWPYLRATPAVSGYPGPRSVLGWVGGTLGRTVAMVGLGGAGFGPDWDERWTLAQLRGLRNILRHLEMLPGKLELPGRYLFFNAAHDVLAPATGLLTARVRSDHLGARLEPGEPLAELWDPQTLARTDVLAAPCRGVLVSLRGSGPVRAGASCYQLADLDDPDTSWEAV